MKRRNITKIYEYHRASEFLFPLFLLSFERKAISHNAPKRKPKLKEFPWQIENLLNEKKKG